MATSSLARFTMRASLLRSMSSKRPVCAIWTSSALPAYYPAIKQISLVSQVKCTQPTRLYSATKLTKADVDSRVLMVCKAFDKITADKVSLESHFINDLGLDSLDHVEVIMAIEDEFGFEIPDEHSEKLLTPAKIAQYVCDHEKIFS